MSDADVSAGAAEPEALPLPRRNSAQPGAAMSGTSSPEAVKKLLENMQGDLRGLSLECRKKFPPVKEVRSGRAAAPLRRDLPRCGARREPGEGGGASGPGETAFPVPRSGAAAVARPGWLGSCGRRAPDGAEPTELPGGGKAAKVWLRLGAVW